MLNLGISLRYIMAGQPTLPPYTVFPQNQGLNIGLIHYWFPLLPLHIWVFPKTWYPQIIHLFIGLEPWNFHHPFWGVLPPPIFGSTSIYSTSLVPLLRSEGAHLLATPAGRLVHVPWFVKEKLWGIFVWWREVLHVWNNRCISIYIYIGLSPLPGCQSPQWQMKVEQLGFPIKHTIILVVTVTGRGDNPIYIKCYLLHLHLYIHTWIFLCV